MSRHRSDLFMCLRLAGTTPGMVCEKCDGKCPICDSFVHPKTLVRICDECAFTTKTRCVICAGPASAPAFYCNECTILEKDRDGCPNVINTGSSRMDRYFDRAAPS